MNVEIIIDRSGSLTFDMTEEQISKLLLSAFEVKSRRNVICDNRAKEDVSEIHDADTVTGKNVIERIPYRKQEVSKVDRMFGSDWRKSNVAQPVTYNSNFDGYKGFLLLDCPQCGRRKAFCVKSPIKTSICSCGYEIELKDLRTAKLDCKCGKSWTYRTNITEQSFTYHCLECNSPIDLIYNPRHGNFETLR